MTQTDSHSPSEPPSGRLIGRLVPAILLIGLATMLIGWEALLHSRAGVAPVVLFPIGIGVAVGAVQTAILRKMELSLPWTGAVALGLVCGILAVATEDYAGYRDYLAGYARVQRGDRIASTVQATTDQWQPMGYRAYLSAIFRRDPVWWSIDAVLTPLTAAVVAGVASRRRAEKAAE